MSNARNTTFATMKPAGLPSNAPPTFTASAAEASMATSITTRKSSIVGVELVGVVGEAHPRPTDRHEE